MAIDKSISSGTTPMLLLKLLESRDMYGYELIEALSQQSAGTFELKAGTLYPLLHSLEDKDCLTYYEKEVNGKVRKYYHLTEVGRRFLADKIAEWKLYVRSVKGLLNQVIIQKDKLFHVNQIPWCSTLEYVSQVLNLKCDDAPRRRAEDGSYVITVRNPELVYAGFPCTCVNLEFKNDGIVFFTFDLDTTDQELVFYRLSDHFKKLFGESSNEDVHNFGKTLFHVKQWFAEDDDIYSVLQLIWQDEWVNIAVKVF